MKTIYALLFISLIYGCSEDKPVENVKYNSDYSKDWIDPNSPKCPDKIVLIKKGMSEEKVKELIGEPNYIKRWTDLGVQRWDYGPCIIQFEDHKVHGVNTEELKKQ